MIIDLGGDLFIFLPNWDFHLTNELVNLTIVPTVWHVPSANTIAR